MQSGALSALSSVLALPSTEVDVLQEALVAIFLLLEEEEGSSSSSEALQSFLGAGGRAALSVARARPLPENVMEWAENIAAVLPPAVDGEVVERRPEPAPAPEPAPEPEPQPEPEQEREPEQAREQSEWTPPARLELSSTAAQSSSVVQVAHAKVAELQSSMELTQQRAAETQSNVSAALAASQAFESKCGAGSAVLLCKNHHSPRQAQDRHRKTQPQHVFFAGGRRSLTVSTA